MKVYLRFAVLTAYILVGWLLLVSPTYAQVVVFTETFDSGDAPSGWVLDDGWLLSTATPSSGSGLQSLQNDGNAATNAATPPIDLRAATSATLSYLARRTGAYDTDNLRVTASADNGATFPVTLLDAGAALPSTDSDWQPITVGLPGALLGSPEVIIRFEGEGLYAASSTLRIDDLAIEADVPLEISPTSLSFSSARQTSQTKSVTATNYTSGPLTIGSPFVSGGPFTIDPDGDVVVPAGGSEIYSVTFSPSSPGLATASVEFDYGIGAASLALTGVGGGGSLSFATPETVLLAGETSIGVPLHLDYTAETGLQGLQFRIEWVGDPVSVEDVELGSAITNPNDWTLSFESGSGFVDILLLGEGSLEAGTYDELLMVMLAVDSITSETAVPLTIRDVIGALAEPDGSDADLEASADSHVITFQELKAFFEASAPMLDLGDVMVGEESSSTLTVSNPDGTTSLMISDISVSNPLFAVSPATVEIEPDESQDFTITFAPADTSFGRQNGDLLFLHTGEGESNTIVLTGMGRGGRGDVENDGIVDALDIVHAIDFVLGRLTPDDVQTAAADLYPFPAGDTKLDVRDLTVLLQAIIRGQWPDGIGLPQGESEAGKTASGGVQLTVDPTYVELDYQQPIRAFQIVLPASAGASVDVAASTAGGTIASDYNAAAGELRVLVYRMDGSLIVPSQIYIATQGVIGRPRYVAVIGENRERLNLDESVWTGTESPEKTGSVGKPYPNPYQAGSEVLRIPVEDESASVTIYDMLGRVAVRSSSDFEWDGRDASGRVVAPGLYIVEVQSAEERTASLIIVR